MELILRSNVDQRVIRDAAPEEERKTRGEFKIGDAIGLSRAQTFRLALRADQELRAREEAAQSELDTVLECPFAAAFLIEGPVPTPYPAE